MKTDSEPKVTTPEPATVRRDLVARLRAMAKGRKFTAAERAEFDRMADAWDRTLASKESV